MSTTTRTLHLLIHPGQLPLAQVAMNAGDDVILAGEALLVSPSEFLRQQVFALQSDCEQWGLPQPAGATGLSDTEWVTRTAAADRVVVW